VSLVHDNTTWKYLAPNNGSRYNLSLSASPKFTGDGMEFVTVALDYRKYFRLTADYTLAARIYSGLSFGANAPQFMLGGIEGWLNREFSNDQFPITSVNDYAFLTVLTPLRGAPYNIARGRNAMLANLEIRFPAIKYFIGGLLPIATRDIMGAIFLDCGSVWNNSPSLNKFHLSFGWEVNVLFMGLWNLGQGWLLETMHPMFFISMHLPF